MKSRRTHYEVLSVTSSSSLADIKTSYRELLLATHPDKVRGPAASGAERLNKTYSVDEIKEAYRVLADDNLRKKYDNDLLEDGKKKGIYKFGDGVDEVSLDTFDMNEEDSEEVMHYTRKCPRCQVADGFKLNDDLLEEFAVPCENSDDGRFQVLIQCDSCSLWLKVYFFCAEEEEEA
ncbi:Jjj3 protein [Maudiozyma humilis]|uniref:Diphthamide biosynthesis protein 4 n=1 Tax=Maudiozyma humilis TaxID=51915 RepID=A0AAV5RWC5_MAUHU|nr:Jjj3 protein [Kazachstania humilis]